MADQSDIGAERMGPGSPGFATTVERVVQLTSGGWVAHVHTVLFRGDRDDGAPITGTLLAEVHGGTERIAIERAEKVAEALA